MMDFYPYHSVGFFYFCIEKSQQYHFNNHSAMKKTMLRIAILCSMLMVTGMSYSQQRVKMFTSLPEGSEITFLINASSNGVKVDWGDGVLEETTFVDVSVPVMKLNGRVKGSRLVISCDKNLTMLYCEHCGLTELKLDEARELESLYCGNNELTNLDLRKMTRLKDLNCSDNQIRRFSFTTNDVKKANHDLPVIENLNTAKNQFTGTYAWYLPTLVNLDMNSNRFSRINISDSSLQTLNCSGNQLRGQLSLSQVEKLQCLICFNNQCTSLSLFEGGKNIQQLVCDDNLLQSLDLSQAAELVDFSCSLNRLKSVRMPVNAKLSSLNVSDNQLDFSVLPAKNLAPRFLAFLPQCSFGWEHIEGVERKDNVAFIPVSESWSNRHFISINKQGSLANGRTDAIYTWYTMSADGSVREMTRRTSSSGTEDFFTSQGKFAFFTPQPKAYVELTSKNYGFTITSEPVAIGDDVTGVNDMRMVSTSMQVLIGKGALMLVGDGKAAIHTVDGKSVWDGYVDGRKTITLSKGIYIVNNNKVVL